MDRLFPWFLFKGHFRSLSNRIDGEHTQNWLVTLLVYGSPLAAGAFCAILELFFNVPIVLQRPGAVLTAAALLAGGTLTAFTHLSTLRLKLGEQYIGASEDGSPDKNRPNPDAADLNMVDVVATHLVMAALFSTLTALALILGMNFAAGAPGTDEALGLFAWITIGLLVFNAMLYWIATPRLYLTYVELNKVDPRLAGNTSGH